MANNQLSQNENILVVVDQQNIVHIDPNTVVSQSGELKPRLVDHENLVMYVNLEADLVPRTVLYSESNGNTLTSVASGSFTMLRNQGDPTKYENNFDTNWTETFVSNNSIAKSRTTGEDVKYDPTAQTFGIESISIVVKGANNIPQVSINFIDVRGKTLFDSPDNSPYKAFFHQPWPIFYLTVKGYYGKAIRYRLQLVDFKSKFNGNTGNFEITTKFVGSSYAFLNDILLQNIINAPYLYLVEKPEPYKVNEKTGFVEKKVSKSSKGYSVLKSVYDEYKAKGYVPKDFPVKTLRDLLMTVTALDTILEQTLFSETIEPSVLSDVAQYDKDLDAFEKKLINWGSRYLSPNNPTKTETIKFLGSETGIDVSYYPLNKASSDRTQTTTGPLDLAIITGTTDGKSLLSVIETSVAKLEGNSAFGKKIDNKLAVKTQTISLDSIRNIKDFYSTDGGTISVSIEKIVNRLKNIQNTFITKRNEVENAVESKMNDVIIKNDKAGFGFKPTIRNVFAVILANADTYIRLMKDVQNKVVQRATIRKQKIKFGNNEPIYAWPEVVKNGKDGKNTFYYPADPDILNLTNGTDYSIWPEVEFIETYNSVAVKRIDTGTAQEITPSSLSFVFDKSDDVREKYNVSTALNIPDLPPYSTKALSSILYEIFERSLIITSYDTFEYGSGLDEICNSEFKNIEGNTINDIDVRALLSQQVKTQTKLDELMKQFSPTERYPYYQDRLTTVEYIKSITSGDFNIQEYENIVDQSGTKDVIYEKLQKSIDNYIVPSYRLNEFPFNSDLYIKYNGNNVLSEKDYKYVNILKTNTDLNFISSPIKPTAWIDSGSTKNMFTNQISYSGITRNLLNTPYFHKQLYNDFFKGGLEERYAGSAYILLNSLPYKDLDDILDFDGNKILMSSLLKEVGAAHYIPHHLLLKWGAIYHRYKKYLIDGVDILNGVTTQINGSLFFDNATNVGFSLTGNTTPNQTGLTSTITGATYNSGLYVGMYPYYHGIYSQIVNGYSFYNPSGFTKTTADATNAAGHYATAISSGITKFVISKPTSYSGLSFTCLVDNSKFNAADTRYTILPSFNTTPVKDIVNNYAALTQDSFRLIYDSNSLDKNPSYNVAYFPTYGEKFENESSVYSLDGVKKKIVDLIAVFSPEILDEFEKMFIEFSSLDLDIDTSKSSKIKYDSFQKLLKEITSVDQTGIDFNSDGYEKIIKENQTKKLEKITTELLDNKNLQRVSIGNPRQIDNYVLYGYVGNSNTYSTLPYNITQLTQTNKNYIELYIGQNITGSTYNDLGNLYEDFFRISDIEVSPENIHSHRELARVYAGWVKMNRSNNNAFTPTYSAFKNYVITAIFDPQDKRLNDFLKNLISKFTGLSDEQKKDKVTIYHGFNETKTTLLDLYHYFKSFNDKWIAGNAIGQRSLMDEFLFLDRANRDIGDEAYISLERLMSLADEKNAKIDLYSAISLLIQGTNFDLRPLPAYVNFYGTNSTSNKKRILPSKNLARTLFGTHLDVDYQESSPKIIIQYVNKTSQYLDMSRVSKEYKFKNDGFDIKDPNGNPLLIEPKIFMDTDLSKSNRVVSFEINFGDQSQNIFKNISLDQSTYKNTTESALAQERLARQQSGGGSYQVDIGLFDIYKTASYQCTVSCMGNAMIQPTMYFYLANVPMFAGTYLVFDVTHNIKPGGFETNFTGVRISSSTLPTLENSFMSSYRPLFSRILSAAVKKKQKTNQTSTTVKTLTTKDNKSFTIDPGTPVAGEDLNKIIVPQSGFLYNSLIPYNGQIINGKPEQYIQLIKYNDDMWFRTRVCVLGSGKYTPTKEGKPADMSLVSLWKAYPTKEVKLDDINLLYNFYSVRGNVTKDNREELFKYNTIFYNPKAKINYTLKTEVNPNVGLFNGPVHNGPDINDETYGQYGIALSPTLMRELKLSEGDVVYFKYKNK